MREQNDYLKLQKFFEQKDENGITNAEKAGGDISDIENCPGVIIEDGKFIGLGIHILNESIYPIEKFELFLRDKNLCGHLDLSACKDLVFLDVYRNKITSADVHGQSSMRILGLQDNCISELDVSELSICQGIDIGKNKLKELDVSKNSELVELYIHFNEFSNIDLSKNKKLKYFWCNHNNISSIDTLENPLLRHLDCTDNPLKSIKACAPQQDEFKPLYLEAFDGGYVGLKFCPVYTPQWKETGEWQQSYYAYPLDEFEFDGWYEDDKLVSSEKIWIDKYGTSRKLVAKFIEK